MHATVQITTEHLTTHIIYRMAGNFGGKIFWRIAENISFGGIYFGVEPVLAIIIFIAKWLIERAGNLTGL